MKKSVWFIGLLCLVSIPLVLFFLLDPIFDPDFFWHLKTGQWIWQHGALPASDPFTINALATPDVTQKFKLTSYWLADLLFYGLYQAFGLFGIIGIRVVYVLVMASSLIFLKKRSRGVMAILTVAFLVTFLSENSFERPQIFTFCFFALLLFLIEKYRSEENNRIYSILIPIVALLWTNMHGGFFLLYILCAWFVLGEIYLSWIQKRPLKNLRGVLVVVSVAVAVSFVNPNVADMFAVYKEMLSGSSKFVFSFITEYQSLGTMLSKGNYSFLFFPIIFFLALYFFVFDGLKKNAVNIVFLLGFAFFSYTSMRYLTLFGMFCLPFAADGLSRFRGKKPYALAFLLLAFSLAVTPVEFNNDNYLKLKNSGPVDARFPIGAVSYLKQNQLRGHILNEYDWGGYLIWELGDESKVFIDTRAMDSALFKDWVFMSAGLNTGKLISKYDFDLAVLPQFIKGQPNPLTITLSADKSWKHLYDTGGAAIFVKQ